MHLEGLASIASAEICVEDHLMVEEMRVEVARALEVRHRRPELAQHWCQQPVLDRWWDSTAVESPHLHPLRRPQHGEDAATSSIERGAGELVGRYGASDVRVCELSTVSIGRWKNQRLEGTCLPHNRWSEEFLTDQSPQWCNSVQPMNART
jgi:hypothetical protein